MRALALTALGAAPAVIDVDVRDPGEGEIRVRIRAASVNGFDLAVAAGYLNGVMEHRFPLVLGQDFAGTVESVGPGVTGYRAGDRVFGVVTKPHLGDGSIGEFVLVPVAVGVTKLPENITFSEGAALGLAGCAAIAAVEAAGAAPGVTMLVVGATGGVGNQVVQLAAGAGANVLATADSGEGRALVSALGAAEVVDHSKNVAAQVLDAHPEGVDAVLHHAGEAAELLPIVRPGGRLVSTLLASGDQLSAEGVTVIPVFAECRIETLDRLARNQALGRTRVTIQRVYSLDQAPRALEDFAAEGTLGKLVISMG